MNAAIFNSSFQVDPSHAEFALPSNAPMAGTASSSGFANRPPLVPACIGVTLELFANLPDFACIVEDFEPAFPILLPAYRQLSERLLAPFRSSEPPVGLRVEIARSGTELHRQAIELVNFGYASRFSSDGEFNEVDESEDADCFVVTLAHDDCPVVLATVRAA